MDGEIQSLLGLGARYEGKLTFDGNARIDGSFEGEVFSPGCLVLGPGADVRADIQVRCLIVLGGRIFGQVRATESVEIHRSAWVEADLSTPKLFIEDGARYNGKCSMNAPEIETFSPIPTAAPATPRPYAQGPHVPGASSQLATPLAVAAVQNAQGVHSVQGVHGVQGDRLSGVLSR